MSVLDSFATFQTVVNADPDQVTEARRRRRLFEAAFSTESDVTELVPSGSLARGTHKAPIHDVDLIVVFDPEAHSSWGQDGDSAEDALEYAGSAVNRLLGATYGTAGHEVRLAKPRNHAVKCFLDDPEAEDAFTVDVMPALRQNNGFLIPEKLSKRWITADPEYLIAEAARKHAEWRQYAGAVRMLKYWASKQSFKIKSLVMEVLALDHLPTTSNRSAAVQSFFTAAAYHVESGLTIEDPAGLCGPVQPDLDTDQLAEALRSAAQSATSAGTARSNNDEAAASRHWRDIFGDAFPEIAAIGVAATPDRPRTVKDSPQG
ncbi:nucleotidyltransferase domain-containing protein [Curtobacterium sp. VKM Ac-2865]|uniref:SMODS domain-containing nucleotidyltransferase n=1 Tax=Curtobacterium sp. VKM Ac-2865 TaxID=2783817 RepID=UPI00188BB910|nr:nucleotidyltransferase domain-containing protein [Curtobacterium sp. VKM Ac-2865]MBF4582340.1 nucleotidyltransferase domain-containing protein [Curtobacterium sp. VKM Ac-2865]